MSIIKIWHRTEDVRECLSAAGCIVFLIVFTSAVQGRGCIET